jgi:hypothetical protein
MQGFKAGDKVRVKQSCTGTRAGEIYTLFFDPINCELRCVNPTPGEKGLCSCSSNWIHVESPAGVPMGRFRELSEVQKKNLSKEAQALVRYGILSDSLTITSSMPLLELLLERNFTEIAELAQAKIDEEEEEEKKEAKAEAA